MEYRPYEYQQHATQHVIDNVACGLFLEMGLGKTVSTLTAIDQLMFDDMEVNRVLVIAPKRVAEDTWISESQKWDHLKHLKLSLVLGTESQRKKALKEKADIYVINRENVVWLVAQYGTGFPFDMVVIDELSSFKSAKASRFKALRRVRPLIKRVVGLTGTPAPNGLMDLWSQMYLLDMGERLGETLTGFRTKFFRKEDYKPFGKYEVIKDTSDEIIGEDFYERKIYDKISDICISMKRKDYLKLPERIEVTVPVILHGNKMDQYYEFEKKMVLAMEDIDDISVPNAAALSNKLLQFANGAVYDDQKNFHEVHNEKIEALEEILEAANGKPVMVFYSYRHDLERIKNHLKHYGPEELHGSAGIKKWNEKKTPFLVVHPASAGHGLNMQAGGHIIVWFGCPWSLELYQQGPARLDRPGQLERVIMHRLITKGTMDEDVIAALDSKTNIQEALMNAVKARMKKYKMKVAV